MPRGRIGTPKWKERQTDTEIYCKAREYHKVENWKGVNEELEKFPTDAARRCAKALLECKAIAQALDPLLALSGLRQGFWLRMMHRVIYSGCIDLVLKYLEHVEGCWNLICNGEPLRFEDVSILEKKCPRFSKQDAVEISSAVSKGLIFPTSSDAWRNGVMQRLTRIETLIPSLDTFFDDFKLLEKCKYCFNHIIYKEKKVSIRESLDAIFKAAPAEFNSAYLRLWLYVLQNWRQMTPPSKMVNNCLARDFESTADIKILHSFAILAHDVGFESPKIASFLNADPEKTSAKNCLFKLRKPEIYSLQDSDIEMIENSMAEACNRAERRALTAEKPCLVGPAAQKPRHLSGFPDLASYKNDQKYLEDIESLYLDVPAGEVVTTLFRLKSFFISWFQDGAPPPPVGRPKTGFISPTSRRSSKSSLYTDDDIRNDYSSDLEQINADISSPQHANVNSMIEQDEQAILEDSIVSPTDEGSVPREHNHHNTLQIVLLSHEGSLEVLASFNDNEISESQVNKTAQDIYRKFGNLAFLSEDEEQRLHFIVPADCFDIMKTQGIRRFVVSGREIDSKLLIALINNIDL